MNKNIDKEFLKEQVDLPQIRFPIRETKTATERAADRDDMKKLSKDVEHQKGKYMATDTAAGSLSQTGKEMPPMGVPRYKTIAICPNFTDVGGVISLLKKEGFTNDQISLLGREQEHWQEKLGQEWDLLDTTKGVLEGAALGSIPGLVLVTGVALTGGAGLLVAGPMIGAMAALGLGALGGSVMGGVVTNNTDDVQKMDIEEVVDDAISHGQWVIVAHSHNEAEAMRAHALLPNSRSVMENEPSEP